MSEKLAAFRCFLAIVRIPSVMYWFFASWLAIATSAAQSVAPSGTAGSQPVQSEAKRPRVGLVLGGGGAKGTAHVGVLLALEEMRIPIDCVVGTSVGALVGGIYSSGKSATQVDMLVRGIDWQETLAFADLRKQTPMRRKQAGITYSNSLEFGIRTGGVSAPAGIINTQRVEAVIGNLVREGGGEANFDDLPIPYRSVATDMQKSEMVVFDHGELPQAMRASMAVPGVFAPILVDERVLGDGALVRNLPIDVARSSCADVVIAVWLSSPMPQREELMSPLSLISRSLDVVVDANVRQQLDTLGSGDIAIEVPMGDIGPSDFDRTPDAIPLGLAAAQSMRAQLSRYSVSVNEYAAWRRSVATKQRSPGALVSIEIKGLNRVAEKYVRTALGVNPGDTLSYPELDLKAAAIYALDDFESVSYRLRGNLARPTLELNATEKSWGPHFLRFDLGLAASTAGETAFVLRGDYLRHWVNRLGGEMHGALQLGRTSLFESSLYQPLDARQHRWFVEPAITLRNTLVDMYAGGDAVARYDLSSATGAFDLGAVFGPALELRLGLRGGVARASPDIALPTFPSTATQDRNGWIARIEYDTRNSPLLPTMGSLVRINYFGSEDGFGSASSYGRLEGIVQTAVSIKNDVILAALTGGSSLGSQLPIYDRFLLGGPQSFPGFRIGELLGDQYWTVSTSYLRKIADISSLFGQSLYLGAQLQAGAMRGSLLFDASDEYQQTLYSASLLLTGRTMIGPVVVSLGATNQHGWMLSLGLGRPIEEGNVTDFAR